MRRTSWATLFLVGLLAGLLCLFVGYRVAQSRGGSEHSIVHEIRQMIASIQTPLESEVPPPGDRSPLLRQALPGLAFALAGLLCLGLGLRWGAQQRSRSKRS